MVLTETVFQESIDLTQHEGFSRWSAEQHSYVTEVCLLGIMCTRLGLTLE